MLSKTMTFKSLPEMQLESWEGGVSAPFLAGLAGKHVVLRWYPILDLSSRADRLLSQFHPARHESIVDAPHPHPAIPARQRICIQDRFADVSNAHGKRFHRILSDGSTRIVDGSYRDEDQVSDPTEAARGSEVTSPA